MQASYPILINHIDRLYALHLKNDCVWSDFFAACKDRIVKDPAFGRDFLITAWGGMFNYEEHGVLCNQQDENERLGLAEETYNLATELKRND